MKKNKIMVNHPHIKIYVKKTKGLKANRQHFLIY